MKLSCNTSFNKFNASVYRTISLPKKSFIPDLCTNIKPVASGLSIERTQVLKCYS